MSVSLVQRLRIAAILVAALATVRAVADEADDQFAVAAGLYSQQRWAMAADEFRGFLKAYPGHAKAAQSQFYLGETLVQLGRYDEATACFRQYLQADPNGRFARSALFRVGEAAYLGGRRDQARTALEQFRAKHPDDALCAYVYPYLGDIALEANDARAAVRFFSDGLKRFPEGRLQDDCRVGLARALEKQGNNDEAERLYLAVAGKPSSTLAPDAQFRLAALRYATGNWAEAEAAFATFEKKWPANPKLAEARQGRGWALFKLKRFDEAQAVFQSIAGDAALGYTAHFWIGLCQKAREDWPAAAKTLATLADSDAKNSQVWEVRVHAGGALMHTRDLEGAQRQFDLVLAAGDAGRQWADAAARGRIQVLFEKHDYATADREAAQFSARFPKSPRQSDVQRLLAHSLLERTEFARAVAILEPLVAHGKPGEEETLTDRYHLAVACEALKRHQDTLKAVAPVVESGKGQLKLDAQLAQGAALTALHRYAEAVAPLESMLAGNPGAAESARGRATLAICYSRTGQLDKAKRLFQEVLDKKQISDLSAAAAEQLAETAYEGGDFDWAGQLYARLASDHGSAARSVKATLGLAWTKFKTGHQAEAADLFDQVLKLNPEPAQAAEAALARGQVLEQLGKSDPALAMYDLVIDRYASDEQYPTSLLAAARLRNTLHQYTQAAALFERLATHFPKLPEIDAVLFEWSWALADSGKQAEADKLRARIHQEFRQSRFWPDATHLLAQRAAVERDYAKAATLLDELLAVRPQPKIREPALFLQGQVAQVQNQWDRVRKAYETLLADFPQSTMRLTAEFWVAEAVYRQGDYDAAGKLFDRLATETGTQLVSKGAQQPWQAKVSLRRAQVLVQMKKWTEAQQIAEKIAPEYPNFAEQYEADYVVGRCLAAQADFDGARKAYAKVIKSSTGAKTETAAMAQFMIGESYIHQKNFQAALREYLRLEILYAYPTWQALALLEAGKCHELLGEWKEAAQVYDRLLTVYPTTPCSSEAKQRLQAARDRGAGRPAS